MGRRDANGRRLKWTRAEKRMMKEWREVRAMIWREHEQQRQNQFPDGLGETSAAGASSSATMDPNLPPHLQHLSPRNHPPRYAAVNMTQASSTDKRDEDLISQQSTDIQMQPVSNPNQWDESMTLPKAGTGGQLSGEDSAVPPVSFVNILDIPNDVMEGIFEQLPDAEAV